jgi:hypothetical protein
MKIASFFFFVLAFAFSTYAQPIIQDGSKLPQPGFSAPVSIGSGSIGSAGANQTWDFSGVTFAPIGSASVIDPATSPFISTYPSANYVYTLANTYSYFTASASMMEVNAYSITSPGNGVDMAPNPRTVLVFPFTFGSTTTDTWQKVGSSTNNVTLTYDAYGTLITPGQTYSNVVRIKESYGDGDDYQWYLLDPLMSILVYDHNANKFYLTAATPKASVRSEPAPADMVYFTEGRVNIRLADGQQIAGSTFRMFNILGATVLNTPLGEAISTLPLNTVNPGIYFYELNTGDGNVYRGRAIVQ